MISSASRLLYIFCTNFKVKTMCLLNNADNPVICGGWHCNHMLKRLHDRIISLTGRLVHKTSFTTSLLLKWLCQFRKVHSRVYMCVKGIGFAFATIVRFDFRTCHTVLFIFIFYLIFKVLNFHLRVLYSIQIHDDVYSMKIYMLMIISTMKQIGGFVRLLHCFTNKSYLYNITEIVLNVVLNNTVVFESFPFRQNFVIFVCQITWFRWTNRHWTSGINVHNKNSNRFVPF